MKFTKDLNDRISQTCASFKLASANLDGLFGNTLDQEKNGKKLVDTINLFINFESVYHCLRKKYFENILKAATGKEKKAIYRHLISEYVNIAAHYRGYFNRHKVTTNIFYFYNELPTDAPIEYNNSALIDGYRDHFFESLQDPERYLLNNMVKDTIPFMRTLCEYIDGIYMVSTKRLEGSLIPYIILRNRVFPSNMNFVISRDFYDALYVNADCAFITRDGITPVSLTKRNIMKFFRYKYDFGREVDDENKPIYREINSRLLPFLFVFKGGDRRRSIPRLGIRKRKVYKDMMKLYDTGYFSDNDPSCFSLSSILDVFDKKKKEKYGEIIGYIYRCYDLKYQYDVASKDQIEEVLSQLKNHYDDRALKELNDRYFEDFPLRLMELIPYNIKRKDQIFEET